jgi:hypothetical protein
MGAWPRCKSCLRIVGARAAGGACRRCRPRLGYLHGVGGGGVGAGGLGGEAVCPSRRGREQCSMRPFYGLQPLGVAVGGRTIGRVALARVVLAEHCEHRASLTNASSSPERCGARCRSTHRWRLHRRPGRRLRFGVMSERTRGLRRENHDPDRCRTACRERLGSCCVACAAPPQTPSGPAQEPEADASRVVIFDGP